MRKKIELTIGIPAYNEEQNIRKLIESLLLQKQTNYLLKEIIVVSDKSTDKTESEVKKVDSRLVVLIVNKERMGQALSQNIIVNNAHGEILALLNADIKLSNQDFLSELVRPFSLNQKRGITSAKAVSVKASNFFEKVINFSVKYKCEIFESINKGNNIYTCKGTARAFTNKFYKGFVWPKIVAEDAYTYLYSRNTGFDYEYCPKAILEYKSPSNLLDHQRQSKRFFSNFSELKKYFPDVLLRKELSIPPYLFIKTSLRYLLKNPLYFVSYFVISALAKVLPSEKVNITWTMVASSKNLV